MTQALIWLVLAILAGIFEAITIDLVSIWIAVGCLAAAILAWLEFPFIIQLCAVLLVSILLGVLTRPYCLKILRGNVIATNSDRLIGKSGVITKEFKEDERGEMKVAGEYWTCFSRDLECYAQGDHVKILAIEGVKLLVTKIK